MNTHGIQHLSSWLQQSIPSGGYLLLSLNGYRQLLNAYGSLAFPKAVVSAFQERLAPYGVTDSDILVLDHLMLVRLDCTELFINSGDLLLEHIKVVLSHEPIPCGSHRVVVNVQATWLETAATIPTKSPSFSSDFYSATKSLAFSDVGLQTNEQTREDMLLVKQFFDHIHNAQVVLAFQPMVFTADRSQVLCHQAYMRMTAVEDGNAPASCVSAVDAMERLHLVGRLDSCVVWTVIQTLQQHPDIHLACNISPLSLFHGGWWRLIFSVLGNAPKLASRLILKVTKTTAVFDMDEAVSLLKTLRMLGCRIAMNDIGAGFSALELPTLIKPDIIKVDKSLVHIAREPALFHLLRSRVNASRSISPCVVVEGIESEGDLQLSENAGTDAVQGYFIDPPNIRPPWQATPVYVQDSFNFSRRSMALN